MNTLDKEKQERKKQKLTAKMAAVNAMDTSTDAFYVELFNILYDLHPYKRIQDLMFPEYIRLSIRVVKLEPEKTKQAAEKWLPSKQKDVGHDIDMNQIFDVFEACYMVGTMAMVSTVIIGNKDVS